MKPRRIATPLSLAALAGLLAAPCAGQWPSYRAPGIPRLSDGKPNLVAPTPRTADGKPDLSGMWQLDNAGLGGIAFNVAQDLAEKDIQPWARSVYQQRLLDLGTESPPAHCLPPSILSLNSFRAVFSRIVQAPGLIVLLYQGETNDYARTIFTDGRNLPEDPSPAWLGYSIGHWEGDVLVVNTAGFNDRAWLDFSGHPQTESLRVTEHFLRRDFGHMELEMTLDDANVFARPVSMRINKVLAPDTELSESICENEKDAGHLKGGNGFRLSEESLLKYTGSYELPSGRQAALSLSEGFLVLQQDGSAQKRVLVPQSETKFMFRDNGDGIEFVKDAQSNVTQFVMHPVGGDQRAVRKSNASQGEKK
jgi:hypothetical protein